jgi:hypothetical protein
MSSSDSRSFVRQLDTASNLDGSWESEENTKRRTARMTNMTMYGRRRSWASRDMVRVCLRAM